MRRHHANSRSWTGKDGHVVSAQTSCQAQPHREDRRRTAGPPGDSCRIQLNSIMLMTIGSRGGEATRITTAPTRGACRAIRCATFHPVGPGLFPFRTRVPGARGETMINRPSTHRWIARAALGGALALSSLSVLFLAANSWGQPQSPAQGTPAAQGAAPGAGSARGDVDAVQAQRRDRLMFWRPSSRRGVPWSASTSRGRSTRSDGRPITRRWYGKGRSSRTGCLPPGTTS